jgi:hypothetical protein
VATLLAFWIVYNAVPLYVLQVYDQKNGQVRREIISQIKTLHPEFPDDSVIYVGVPHEKFRDLEGGIPQFYENRITVHTVPPSQWPSQLSSSDFAFEFRDGELRERTIGLQTGNQ